MDKTSVLKYLQLQPSERIAYDSVLQHLKASNSFANQIVNINGLKYIEVRKMMHLVSQTELLPDALFEVFKLSFKVSQEQFNNASINEYFSAKNYIEKMLIDMQKRENELLKSVGTDAQKWEQAGASRLNVFSNILPLVQLGEIYSIYPYDLQERPYNEIITLLICHKTKSEVNSEYQKLAMKK